MLNLGKGGPGGDAPQAGEGAAAIFDVTDADFMKKVIDASHSRPVIVDFWAPWCGPCRTLGPELERAVTAKNGKVALAKVNIDENPMVAQQLRVQSIPAVFAFLDGQPVDGFMGALPASQIQQFVETLVKQSDGDDDLEEIIEAAEKALVDGAAPQAAQAFAAVLSKAPTELRAIAGLARCYAASGDLDRAKQTLQMAPEDKQDDAAIAAARAAIALAEESAEAATKHDELRQQIERDPGDLQARYDYSLAQVASGDREGAVETLLELFRRDREWNEEAAKNQLFKLFEAFGPTDPVTQSGRRRLSSLIYA